MRYDADGAPRALLWSGAPGPVLSSAEDPARIHEDVEAILDLARAPLGAPARGPLADLELAEPFLQDYLDDLLYWMTWTNAETARVVAVFQAHGAFVGP